MKYFFTNDVYDILKNKAELDLNIFFYRWLSIVLHD